MKKNVCYEVLLAINTLVCRWNRRDLYVQKQHDCMSGLHLLILSQTMQRYVLAVLPPRSRQGVKLWHLRQCIAFCISVLQFGLGRQATQRTLKNMLDPEVITPSVTLRVGRL